MEKKGSFLKKLLIAFALILFILFCASQKQASALVAHGNDYDIPFVTDHYHQIFNQQGDTNQWFDFTLQQDMEITNDYDLIGFKFNKINSVYLPKYYNTITNGTQTTGNPGYTEQITLQPETWVYGTEGVHVTFNGILFDDNGTGYICYLSSEAENTFLCPITRGMKIHSFDLVVNVSVGYGFQFDMSVEIERNKMWYNYDSTEIINSNGQVIQNTQQINDNLTNSNVSGAGSSGLNDINNNASAVSTELDNTVGTGDFVTIFTSFFSQIDNSSCTPISLPIPYTNEHLVLPCLGTEFQNRIPLLWTLYVTIITGVIVFRFWRFYIDMFKHLLDPYSTGLHGVSDIAGGGK